MDFEEIKQAVGANEIILAELIGSKFYGANNPKDEDFLIVVDSKKDKWQYKIEKKDLFVITNDEYKKHLSQEYSNTDLYSLCSFLNHEAAKSNLRNSVVYGECEDRKISLFDSKKEVFERVMRFGERNFFNPIVRNRNGNKGCAKMMSWALWYYYAFLNGTLELTREQQNTIQLCHDGNLPIEYAKDLREKISRILQKA